MKKLILYIFIIFTINSCYKSIITTGVEAEINRSNLLSISVGMKQAQVQKIMGCPFKIERKKYENKVYEVWFYVTKPLILGQTRWIAENFTPLVFQKGILKGWGNRFYKHTFNLEKERLKKQEEERQKFIDDEKKWPRNKHLEVAPMNETSEDNLKKTLDEDNLKKTLDTEDIDKEEIKDEDTKHLKGPCQNSKDKEKGYHLWD